MIVLFFNDNCEERGRITLKNKLTKEEATGFCTFKLRSDKNPLSSRSSKRSESLLNLLILMIEL